MMKLAEKPLYNYIYMFFLKLEKFVAFIHKMNNTLHYWTRLHLRLNDSVLYINWFVIAFKVSNVSCNLNVWTRLHLRCMFISFKTISCVVTKTISVALLLYPGLGLARSESEKWRIFRLNDI